LTEDRPAHPPPAGWAELIAGRLAPRTALVLLGIWLNAADGLVTSTIMPSVARDIGGYAWFGWAVAIYLLGSILAAASAGQLAARLGLARAIVLAALAYAGGCALSAAATGIPAFMIGRLAQGMGGGWVVGFCYVAIERMFEERLWARMFGAGAGVWGIASFLVPLVGGAFAQAHFWRGAFWMFAAQGVALAVAAPLLLGPSAGSDDEAARRPLAWRTLAVLTAAILAIAAADVAQGATPAILLLILGLALLVLAGAVNSRPGERLLPPQVTHPATVVGSGYAMIFAMSAASVVFGVYGAAILQVLYGLSPLMAGYVVASDAVGWTLTALIVSGQPDRRHGAFILAGASIIVAGMALLALTIGSGVVLLVAASGVILGAGFGLAWSLVTRRILMALPAAERATGAAATPTAQMIGSAAGAAAAGAVANLLGLAHAFTPSMAASAAPWLFAAFTPLAVLGLVAAARLAGFKPPKLAGSATP
jgi:MFS family permease